VAAPSNEAIVTVDILGQRYPIRSALDPAYVTRLAGYVDEKMQAALEQNQSADVLRVAVLAALNIADEFFRSRDAQESREAQEDRGMLAARTAALERLIDGAISLANPAPPPLPADDESGT
jgi:cell division protein ZapA